MDGTEVTPIPGTEDAIHPFFSPDGQWVGFTTQDRVRKVSLQGGGVITLCHAATSTRATWAENGIIYFAPTEARMLWEVPENGGEARLITKNLAPRAGTLSQVLPDGRAALISELAGFLWRCCEDGRCIPHRCPSSDIILQGEQGFST